VNELTSILPAIKQGDPRAAEQLLPLVYDELRKLAAESHPGRRSKRGDVRLRQGHNHAFHSDIASPRTLGIKPAKRAFS